VQQSIRLTRVSDGKVLYDFHGSTPLVPASVSKLISSAALFSYLGPTHRFTTSFYHSGTFTNGTISGDLIIVGDGDPLLVSEDLWQITSDLKNLGLRRISGTVVVDNRVFSPTTASQAPDFSSGTTRHAYDAPVTAFGVNFNTLTLAISPGAKVGAPALVSLDPVKQSLVHFENQARTSAKGSMEISVERLSLAGGANKLVVTGSIPLGAPLHKIYRSVENPEITAGEYVRGFLAAQGITCAGSTRSGSLPANARLLVSHKSKELSQILRSLMLFSNNYIADVLVTRLGAYPFPQLPRVAQGDGPWERGLHRIEVFLRDQLKWRKEDYTFASGSGLSPDNRLSAENLVSLLTAVNQQWEYFPEFLATLPLAGKAGSLERRFRSKDAQRLLGNIRAKTGTFVSPLAVSALAGYFNHPREHLIAFAIIQNGIPGKAQPTIADLHQSEERGLAEIFEIL
jgi:D-alanyl-D-alanine carboxypeptidase/D-alanyl-D-alanine-endopeptidase (penicillin-binding protein 4)